MWFSTTGRAEGAIDQSYPHTIRMVGAKKGWPEFGKGSLEGATEVCFCCYVQRKRPKGYGKTVGKIWIQQGNSFSKKGLDSGLIIRGAKNIVWQIQGNTIEEPGLKDVFHFSDTCVGEKTTLWEELFGWRIQERYWEQIKERW